ncbi:hypothetical protein Acr_24g0007400 [Actinidia rufa]|uniref:Uncharacterized protein n=1 Tax=Actinidia rufa TaxID=165716 RepID=A0A7J0GUN7_9ERIC|nr:hypothetical protein Acr_24g0007400 [Actinidia rufa]
MVSNKGNKGDNPPTGNAAPVSGDDVEFHHSRGKSRPSDYSQDSLIEYLGTIKKRMRKILPHFPDQTLLRLIRGKVKSLVPSFDSGNSSSSSSSSSEAW